MKTQVYTLRGLFEKRPVDDRVPNMLSNLTGALDRNRFDVQEFPEWQAGFGDYDRELNRVAWLLAEAVHNHDGPVILVGYSGGADVVHAACPRMSFQDQQKVVRTVLCADPSMPLPGSTYTDLKIDRIHGSTRPAAWGIAESNPIGLGLNMPAGVDYVCDAGDPICFTPDGSPLRSLAAFLTSVGPDVGMPLRMRVKLAAAAVGRRYDLGVYGEAVALLRAYSGKPSAHVAPYPPLLAALGKQINREVGAA